MFQYQPGASAAVVSSTSPEKQKTFWPDRVCLDLVIKLFTLKQRYLTVSVDGKALKYRAIEVAIFNSGSWLKRFTRRAGYRIDDGHLDVGSWVFRQFWISAVLFEDHWKTGKTALTFY